MACNYLTIKGNLLIFDPNLISYIITTRTLSRLLCSACCRVEHYIASRCRNFTGVPAITLACHKLCSIPCAIRKQAWICVCIATYICPTVFVVIMNSSCFAIKFLVIIVYFCIVTAECAVWICRICFCIKLIALNCCRINCVAVACS